MASEKKQITRNRTSYSCQMCRRRKVRCDKKHPRCGGCIKADEICVYGDLDNDHNDLPRQSTAANSVPMRKRRAIDDGHVDAADHNGKDRNRLPALHSIEQKLSQLTSLIRDINRLTPDSASDSRNGDGTYPVSISHHGFEKGTKSSGRGIEKDTNGTLPSSTANDPISSWDKVLGNLQQLNELFNVNNRADGIDTSKPETNVLQRPTPLADPWKPKLNNDMLAPTESECAVLFRSWLWSIYPILPLISPHVVQKKYLSFRQWYMHGLDRGEPNPEHAFMPFLVMVWYTGYENLSEKAKRKWFPWALNNSRWNRGLRTWLESGLEGAKMEAQPSVFSLATAMTFQYLGMGGQDMMKNHVRNVINLRTAQNLAIHNERTLKDLSVPQAEMRRRIWWEALSMDTSISTVAGMPVILDERYTDTKMMSDLKESSLCTPEAQEYEAYLQEPGASPDRPDDPANCQTSSLVSVYHLVARARHIMTIATNHVLKANMSAGAMTMDELKAVRKSIQKAGDDIRGIINRIQTRGIPELEFVPETRAYSEVDHLDAMGEEITSDELNYFLRDNPIVKETNPILKHHRATTIAFHKWARVMLSMTIDRLECISYAPFLKKSKSRLWAVARNCALRSCHAFMRKFLWLAEDPELRAFRWAWTSAFHPMHATIIMLVDVHDRPHSDEAPRSRALIDRMFTLMCIPKFMDFPQFGETNALPLREGGEEAWTMLRKLRHKAWQSAGLDPDVLWTEEDQMSVGVGKALNENDLFIRSLREDIILHRKQREGRRDVPLFVRPPYETLQKQRLHPSDAGQGDQITGSIVREVEDLENFSSVPQILLLRARNDQELMPYPATGRTQEITTNQNREMQNPSNEVPRQTRDGVQISNIGDLIRKIQQTKRADEFARSALAHKTVPPPSSEALSSIDESTDTPQCGFRTMRSVENAAYQDISEALSTVNIASHVPSTAEPQGTFTYLPTASTQFTESHKGSTNPEMPFVYKQQGMEGNVNGSSFIVTASLPEPSTFNSSIQSHDPDRATSEIYQAPYGQQKHLQHQAIQRGEAADLHSQANDRQRMETSSSGGLESMADNVNDTADVMEFDWDRWDEMFGQFAGFGDMLMEVYEHEESDNY